MRPALCAGHSGLQAGFTLIELMVTLTIAAVLMLVAVPGMTAFKRNADLVSATNTLMASIHAARGEAMKRGMNAMVSPAQGGSWNTGWVVFVDINRDGALDAADPVVSTEPAMNNAILVSGTQSASGAQPYILFDASGYARSKDGGFASLTLTLARTDMPQATAYTESRRLKVAQTGRVRSCKPASLADVNCSEDVED